MAEEDNEQDSTEAPKKKSKMKLIIILVVLLLGGGGGGYFFLMGEEEPVVELTKEEERAKMVEDGVRGGRAKFEGIVVNLSARESFLRTTLEFELWDPDFEDLGAGEEPAEGADDPSEKKSEWRDVLLEVLAEKTPEDLLQPGGQSRLKEEIKAKINGKYPEEEPIRQVYFLDFVVQ